VYEFRRGDMKDKLKIGLALGSGAARGLAHIGVIETLKKYDIPIHIVAGSSAGAMIGAMYCCEIDFKYVKALCKNLQQKDYVDISIPRVGFIKGDRVQEIFKVLTKDCDFKDLKIPLIVAATDLKSKQAKFICEGKVHEALRASISVPGVFIPYFKEDMVLIDGGVLERVPVRALKDKDLDFIIGVDVGFNMITSNCKSIFHVLFEAIDLIENELFSLKKQEADIMIRVDLNDLDPTRFDQVDLCVERGVAAAEKSIAEIFEKISNINRPSS
jgi:NTE family protein